MGERVACLGKIMQKMKERRALDLNKVGGSLSM
jgi:hypothetical protein